MRKKELYRTLVHRYLNRTASAEELQVFFHLLEKGKLQKQLLEATQDAPVTSPGRVLFLVRRYGVAAAVLIALLGVGSFLLWHVKSRIDSIPAFVSVLHNDIDPGTDRATLTFDDGKEVSLANLDDYNRWRGEWDVSGGNGARGGAGFGGSGNGAGGPNGVGANGVGVGGGRSGVSGAGHSVDVGNGGRTGGRGHMQYRLLATPAGGQYRLTLADGTKVWLNSQSSIRYPKTFAGKTRLVEVTGEAYFDVAHDARRPFVVKAGKLFVQALGTQFNVHAYSDEPAKATLIQGSVRVIDGIDSLLLTPGQEGVTDAVAGNSVMMTDNNGGAAGGTTASGATGSKATGSKALKAASNGERLTLNSAVDTAQAAAWKDGYFDFDNQNIQTIMRQFARWYDIRIVFASKPSTALFAGRLQRSLRLSQVMIGLGTMGVHSRLEGRTLTILP